MPRKKVDAVDTLDKEKETSLPQAVTEQEAKGPEIETAAGTVKTSGRSEGAGIAKGKPAEPSFFDVDYNELDRDLSPDQLREWTAIYASYRSRTPLTGTIIGVDSYRLAITDPATKKMEHKQISCLVVMDFRVKVIIPQTEIWFDTETNLPDYVVKKMIGAKVDYVVTNVDRPGECAIASRRMALGHARNRFFKDLKRTVPDILTCNVLVVGPNRIIAECNGFDLNFRNRDLSYTAIADLRTEYRPGQELEARFMRADQQSGALEVSVKEVNPNPFYGADKRHPVGSTRQAVISGTYAGGVFCRLIDDTTCLCLYSPNYFSEEFYIGDSVLIAVTRYDYGRKLIYGRILSKM